MIDSADDSHMAQYEQNQSFIRLAYLLDLFFVSTIHNFANGNDFNFSTDEITNMKLIFLFVLSSSKHKVERTKKGVAVVAEGTGLARGSRRRH